MVLHVVEASLMTRFCIRVSEQQMHYPADVFGWQNS